MATQKSSKDKFLDTIQPFVIGGLSGMFATCIVQPMDMIKVTIQLKSEQGGNTNPFSVAKQIYQKEGIRGFYRGYSLFIFRLDSALVRQLFYTTTRLGVYKTVTEKVKQQNIAAGRTACASFAGFIGALVGNPPDLVLVRMQADSQLPPEQRRNYKNVFDAFRTIVKEEGVMGLWRGATPTVIRAVVLNLAMLASYDEVKEQIMKRTNEQKETTLIRVEASLISGFLSSFCSLPFDNAKTKIQKMKKGPDGTFPYKNIFDAMAKTVQHQGFTHLWVGFPTFYFRIAPHVCITLVTQDYLTDLANRLRGKAN